MKLNKLILIVFLLLIWIPVQGQVSNCKENKAFRKLFFNNLLKLERCVAKEMKCNSCIKSLVFFEKFCGIRKASIIDFYHGGVDNYQYYSRKEFENDKKRFLNWYSENRCTDINHDRNEDTYLKSSFFKPIGFEKQYVKPIETAVEIYIYQGEIKSRKYLVNIVRQIDTSNVYERTSFSCINNLAMEKLKDEAIRNLMDSLIEVQTLVIDTFQLRNTLDSTSGLKDVLSFGNQELTRFNTQNMTASSDSTIDYSSLYYGYQVVGESKDFPLNLIEFYYSSSVWITDYFYNYDDYYHVVRMVNVSNK